MHHIVNMGIYFDMLNAEIADSEMTLWRLVSTFASLPTMTVREAITFWTNN